MTKNAEREVIFEITRIGEVQRVAAVDVETGVEAVVMAPVNAALADVRALAMRKLVRLLESAPVQPVRRGLTV